MLRCYFSKNNFNNLIRKLNKLTRKKFVLNLKEKELSRKERLLKCKNHRGKAEAELARSKKKSLLDADEERDKNNKCKTSKSYTKEKRKASTCKDSMLSLKHPHLHISELLKYPCTCSSIKPGRNRVLKNKSESCFNSIFRGPCGCKSVKRHPNESLFKIMFPIHPCRCHKQSDMRRSKLSGAAGDCYLMSLRKTPQPWIYHRWPQFYPHYLSALHQWKNLGHVLLFLTGKPLKRSNNKTILKKQLCIDNFSKLCLTRNNYNNKKSTLRPKVKKQHQKCRRNNNINILYSRQTPSLTMKNNKHESGNETKSPCSILSFQSNFRKVNPNLLCQTYSNNYRFTKVRRKKKKADCINCHGYKSSLLDKLRKSKSEADITYNTCSSHYNLVGCLQSNNKQKYNQNGGRHSCVCEHYESKDRQVLEKLIQSNTKCNSCDAIAVKSSILLNSTQINYPNLYNTRETKCSYSKSNITRCFSTSKIAFKYLIIIITFIVWSPCIVAILLSWLINYLMRPNCTTLEKTEYKQDCLCTPNLKKYVVQFLNQCKNNYLNVVIDTVEKKGHSIVSSLNNGQQLCDEYSESIHKCNIKKIIPKKSYSCSRLPYQPNLRPNPNKRYTLQYEDDKGWVIKPIVGSGDHNFSCRTEVVQHVKSCQCPPKPRNKKFVKFDQCTTSVQKGQNNTKISRQQSLCECSRTPSLRNIKRKTKIEHKKEICNISGKLDARPLQFDCNDENPPANTTTVAETSVKSSTNKTTSKRELISKLVPKETSSINAKKLNRSSKCNIIKPNSNLHYQPVPSYRRPYFHKKTQKSFNPDAVRYLQHCKVNKKKKDKCCRPSFRSRLCYLCQTFGRDFKKAVSDAETAAWGDGVECENLYNTAYEASRLVVEIEETEVPT
ncbi:uncharacterized protein LOC131850574 [Achroia grisella]|uniref:uncharacterized protein LOC131850574 n=1 Tax=Achroia grisella TaxID=688607 RepID=UPI0027D2694E|nr:uncharacterized protein LOC131850574 [Achroia grisella]